MKFKKFKKLGHTNKYHYLYRLSLHSVIFNCNKMISDCGKLIMIHVCFLNIVKFYGIKTHEAIVCYNSNVVGVLQ